MTPRRPTPLPRRGFSLIEVLLVIVITVFGFLGIITLQVRSVQAVSDAKEIMLASTLAGHFLETVKVEALQWQNAGALGLGQTQFLYLSNANGQWQPAYLGSGGASGRVERMGNANQLGAGSPLPVSALDRGVMGEISGQVPRFCVFYRLTPIVPDTVLRLEARVLFRRSDGVWGTTYTNCGADALTTMVRDQANVGTVSALTTVALNLAGM